MTAKRSRRSLRRQSRRQSHVPRDMDASSFAHILSELVARIPGAESAVLVDGGGEAVDYAGTLDPFSIKLAGAHWQIILRHAEEHFAGFRAGTPRSLAVRAARGSYITRALDEGYVIVVTLSRRAGLSPVYRAFSVCERALAREAGWSLREPHPWFDVVVAPGPNRRPARVIVATTEIAVEVLGSLAGLGPRERGYRVRAATGAEFTLVREPGGLWYADEPVIDPAKAPAPSRPALSDRRTTRPKK